LPLLALRAPYPATILFRSAFELTAGLQTAQAGQNVDLSTEGGLVADTLQLTGHKRGAPDSVSGRNKNAPVRDSGKALPANTPREMFYLCVMS